MSTLVVTPNAEQEKIVTDFLKQQQVSFIQENETPPDFVLEGIAKSREDFEAGRVFSFEEFKRQFKSAR